MSNRSSTRNSRKHHVVQGNSSLISYIYLLRRKLDQNFLTGPLPAFLGNLSALQTLSVGINALSGTIPPQLGGLRNLRLLAFGSNNFSGSLPPELGSLVSLEQIYMDSAGVSGPIPTTFVNLVNMQTMWASDNAFTGRIPDFIGNWTDLTSLRFQGNSFQGPIPSSYSNLTSLTDLRISDLANVSSSLEFLRNIKNLTVLTLRNNLLSGTIPSNIGEYQQLQRLDFSFNNLVGPIPGPLFNLSSLSYLFLGNNSLSGTIPPQKSPLLLTVDLSYNRLSGSLPSWVSQRNLSLSVVANNLTFNSSSNSVLPSGINCIQRNFPCNRDSPRYSSFALNCGGPQKTSTDGTDFEAENSTLGPASYYVQDDRWAVSNIGVFGERFGAPYIQNNLAQATGTLDPELFQTARLSPGSLRYFGLGLENGRYNVNLQFSETGQTESSRTWESLGRRVFDIYLQGNREIKDFNIRSAAGGAVDRAVQRDFKVQVSENFLEIHLFWAGKGTCCIPVQGFYGPSISAIRVTPDFRPSVSNRRPPTPTGSKKNRTGMIVGITLSIGLLSIICAFTILYLRRKRSSGNEEEELLGIENRPNTFSYAELRTATGDFNLTNKLGEGGFGPVYKGMLSDGREVAVKKLLVTSHQGKSQFVAEISTISAVQHRNLVKLYGCCIEGANRLLVYEYLKNKSLDQALFGLDFVCENNNGLELVDPTLVSFNGDEAIRTLGIALLCTQASPMMRPSMSRVVGMLTGDIQVSTVVSKPSYLTDWQFNDISTFVSDDGTSESTSNAPTSQFDSSSNASMVFGADNTPKVVTRPMPHEVIVQQIVRREGGFGPGYKGMLSDGREIAVKKLLVASHHGKSQFVAEVSIISAVCTVPTHCQVQVSTSQAQTPTDPTEDHSIYIYYYLVWSRSLQSLTILVVWMWCNTVRALNSIFQQWGISAVSSWNISGNPCTGAAIDTTEIHEPAFNPGIKCNCGLTNGTCHITQLRVFALSVRGVIPEELGSLTFLTFLKLDQNYLTGPLPAFLGNLSALLTLSVGINALSGTIPPQLGGLRNLLVLAFGSNNFSGSLPPELGSLVSLEQIYMDSAGVSGPIPTTFVNLVNMQTMWASDNPFTGRIPDFIGNWTKLTVLRFQGNSFQGPIPSSYSNLTSLTDLRISDLANVSSSLEFLRNIKNLTVLTLRNNLLSGTIPSNIGEYQQLQRLDFSFNNLVGQIPGPLFNLSSLSYLFLGNNSLSGAIPLQKSPLLLTVDLSYNRLSGSLPSWVAQRNLSLSVVANNLTFDSSSNSVLPSGINCIQRNFPCNRDSPRYSSFALNCGGPQKTSTDGTDFEAENSTLGSASYYVQDDRWAVSNIGVFGERFGAPYIQNNLAQATGTLDPELFQTARLSPGSLRYFGLGLENGRYNVNLQFSETGQTESSRTWESLGRRVFDIYLQGNRVIKDFNIRSEAGGAVNRAVQRDFKVQVSENFLEIHLFWAGKGTCCIPVVGFYGASISAIRVTPDFRPSVSNRRPPTPTGSKKNRTGMIVGITLSIGLLSIICAFTILYLRRKRSSGNEEEELLGIENRPNTFSYAELRTATGDFNLTNKLGEGGFGPVYKGMLSDGREVAVKKLLVTSHQGKSQFVAEISTISAVQHRNLVKLYGCCIEGANRLLVYEYLKNKSLDQALFGNKSFEQTPYKFFGYLAPEYAMRGHLTEKADVFGFGVVALEILCGRPNSDANLEPGKIYLLEWRCKLYSLYYFIFSNDSIGLEFVRKQQWFGAGGSNIGQFQRRRSYSDARNSSFVHSGITNDASINVTSSGNADRRHPSQHCCSKPSYLTDWQFNDISTFVSDDGTSDSLTSNAPTSQFDSSSNASMVFGGDNTPKVVTRPMPHEVIGEGR
ncbi:hypothetical protein IFM89_002635 [Coptis chinensis]|uniref:non-specific serine/threonine protein kinase n=1 Tax=Coptis chinensis TaxID=261450 RepID=A0A835LD64_9MAGN|nr:hypothetical protein IFM89_002635 [Coptis chinensis]